MMKTVYVLRKWSKIQCYCSHDPWAGTPAHVNMTYFPTRGVTSIIRSADEVRGFPPKLKAKQSRIFSLNFFIKVLKA